MEGWTVVIPIPSREIGCLRFSAKELDSASRGFARALDDFIGKLESFAAAKLNDPKARAFDYEMKIGLAGNSPVERHYRGFHKLEGGPGSDPLPPRFCLEAFRAKVHQIRKHVAAHPGSSFRFDMEVSIKVFEKFTWKEFPADAPESEEYTTKIECDFDFLPLEPLDPSEIPAFDEEDPSLLLGPLKVYAAESDSDRSRSEEVSTLGSDPIARTKRESVSKKFDRSWLLESVSRLRAFGFFEDLAALAENELVAALRKRYRALWLCEMGDERFPGWLWDIQLITLDPARTWRQDPECAVCEANKVYEQLLGELAGISRGRFAPTKIKERWSGEEGPIEVSFLLGREKVRLQPLYELDYVSLSAVAQLNRSIECLGFQFEVPHFDANDCVVVALTADEKAVLGKERGWKFCDAVASR